MSIFIKSSKREGLLPPTPPRTVRETFASHGSSASQPGFRASNAYYALALHFGITARWHDGPAHMPFAVKA